MNLEILSHIGLIIFNVLIENYGYSLTIERRKAAVRKARLHVSRSSIFQCVVQLKSNVRFGAPSNKKSNALFLQHPSGGLRKAPWPLRS